MDILDVPKTGKDMRIIYNDTSCGLNAAVWALKFWFPMAKTAVRALSYNYCGLDKNLGEIFLNFPLPEVFKNVSGVDLKLFKKHLGYKDGTQREGRFEDIRNKEFCMRWN